MDQIYRLSNQGFGVHTFEIKISHMKKQDYHTIRDRIKDISEHDKEKKCYIVKTQRNSGLRIKLYKNHGYPSYLSVIVNPCQLLGDNDPCHILSCFNKKQLRSLLDHALMEYLGNEYGISRFQLTRIDCTADFIMASSELTTEYIKLISRSIRLNQSTDTFGFYKDFEYNEDSEKNDHEEKHCFRMTNRYFYSFTVYDKLYDLIRKGYCGNISYPFGRLRFELALMHRKICKIASQLNTNDIIELVSYFINDSENILKDFVGKKIISGDYYKYAAAKKLIAPNGSEGKTAHRLLKLLIMSEKSKNFNDLMIEVENEFRSDAKIRAVKELMKKLSINPAVIRQNTLYNYDYLPGIHSMFGIERARVQKQ